MKHDLNLNSLAEEQRTQMKSYQEMIENRERKIANIRNQKERANTYSAQVLFELRSGLDKLKRILKDKELGSSQV